MILFSLGQEGVRGCVGVKKVVFFFVFLETILFSWDRKAGNDAAELKK